MHSASTTGSFSTTEARSTAVEMVQPLSEANLVQYTSMQTTEHFFEEHHIRQEGMQLFDRAYHAFVHRRESKRCVSNDEEPTDDEASIDRGNIDIETRTESMTRQYPHPGPSSAPVMHRFAFVSPQSEPLRLHATNALKACGIDEGSLDGMNLRAAAARTVAALKAPSESDSTKAVTSDASADSDSDCEETLEADSEVDGEPKVNRSSIMNAFDRSLVKGRERRKRAPRVGRAANDAANKRQRVERS